MANLTLEGPNSINTQSIPIKAAPADQKKDVRGGSFLMPLLSFSSKSGGGGSGGGDSSSSVRAIKGEDSKKWMRWWSQWYWNLKW